MIVEEEEVAEGGEETEFGGEGSEFVAGCVEEGEGDETADGRGESDEGVVRDVESREECIAEEFWRDVL